jgi:serine/threonine protein kinase
MASPESCNEEPLTQQIDVYGLGALIFFLLTKEKPYAYNSHDDNDFSFTKSSNIAISDKKSLLLSTGQQAERNNKKANKEEIMDAVIAHWIQSGVAPVLSQELNKQKDDDPAVQGMISVMRQAMQYDPQLRPTAQSLANQLLQLLLDLDLDP